MGCLVYSLSGCPEPGLRRGRDNGGIVLLDVRKYKLIADLAVAAPFIGRLENGGRDPGGFAVCVKGQEGRAGCNGVPSLSREEVLRLGPHTRFHGALGRMVDAGSHGDEVADENGVVEIEPVDGGRGTVRSGLMTRVMTTMESLTFFPSMSFFLPSFQR